MSHKINLLLIGYWGNGKSATGNTLLGYEAFPKNNSTIAVNTLPAAKSSTDGKITVVDGLCLWGKDPESLDDDTLFDAQNAVAEFGGEGFDAIVIVLRYGETYSDEEAKLVMVAKKVFGSKILEKFGVCLVTRGDDFKYAVDEREEQCSTFEEWCKTQSGNLGKLFKECGQRCVLFDNKTKDPKQKINLLRLVDNVTGSGAKRYTIKEFRGVHGREFSPSESKMLEMKARSKFQIIRETLKPNPGVKELQLMDQGLRKLTTELKGHQQMEKLIAEAQTLNNMIRSALEKMSIVKSQEQLGAMTGGLICATDKQVSGMTFHSDHFNEDANSCRAGDSRLGPIDGQHIADKVQKLINNFEEELNVNFYQSHTDIKTEFEKLKCQVLEMVKNTPYLNYYKSLIENRQQALQQKLNWEAPTSSELHQKTKSMGQLSKGDADGFENDKKVKDDSIRLLMLGRSGNGKSSTGNSILGQTAFKISSSTAATKSKIECKSEKLGNLNVSVVDGPSLDDAVLDANSNLDLMIESIREALQMCEYGFSGLLVVLKFGQRFMKQEKDAIVMIKSILGKDVLTKYGVCVMTHGDDYDSSMDDDERVDFDEWCRQQTGDIAGLFGECSYRCVLFNNKTRDEQMKADQRNKLLSLIRLENKYSEEEFIETEKDFDELSIQCAIPRLEEANSIIMSKVREKLHQIEQESPNNSESCKLQLETLLKETQEYKRNIESLGHHSSTEYILHLVSTLELRINSKLRLCTQKDELRKLDTGRQRLYEPFNTPTADIHETLSHPLSAQTRMKEAEERSRDGKRQIDALNKFVDDIYLRWTKSIKRGQPDLQEKKMIIQAIDRQLEEVKYSGVNNDAVDHAVAQLFEMKDRITSEMTRQSRVQTGNPYLGNSMQSVTVEGGFELVYPSPQNTTHVHMTYPHPYTQTVMVPNRGYQQYSQGQTSQNYHSHSSYSFFPATNMNEVKYKKTKKSKWKMITSTLKRLRDMFNPFI